MRWQAGELREWLRFAPDGAEVRILLPDGSEGQLRGVEFVPAGRPGVILFRVDEIRPPPSPTPNPGGTDP
jgi:hypothetical protein